MNGFNGYENFGGGGGGGGGGDGNYQGGQSFGNGFSMGGGGFMPDSTSLSQQNMGSPGQGEKKRVGNTQTLTPLTVAQMHAATEEESSFRVDGAPLQRVSVVGMIKEVKQEQITTIFTLDDGTGQINVRDFSNRDSGDDAAAAQLQAQLREGVYVRVVGELRVWTGMRSLFAFNMRPVTDFDEITHHMLEVVRVHLFRTRGPLKEEMEVQQKDGATAFGGAAAAPNAAAAAPMGVYGAAPAAVPGGGNAMNNLTDMQKAVLKLIETSRSTKGVSVTELAAALPQYSEPMIRNELDYLSTEGYLYSTIDEEHFLFTSSMPTMA